MFNETNNWKKIIFNYFDTARYTYHNIFIVSFLVRFVLWAMHNKSIILKIVNTIRVCYIVIGGSRGKDLVMLFLARRSVHAYMAIVYESCTCTCFILRKMKTAIIKNLILNEKKSFYWRNQNAYVNNCITYQKIIN